MLPEHTPLLRLSSCCATSFVNPTWVPARCRRYLDLLRQPGGVNEEVWREMRQLAGGKRRRRRLCAAMLHRQPFNTAGTAGTSCVLTLCFACYGTHPPRPPLRGADMRFNFRDKAPPYSYASSMSHAMQVGGCPGGALPEPLCEPSPAPQGSSGPVWHVAASARWLVGCTRAAHVLAAPLNPACRCSATPTCCWAATTYRWITIQT